MIAGLVVAGFGLAPVYLSPLSQYLLGRTTAFGSRCSIFGVAFAVIVCGLAQLLRNPPPGFVAGAQAAAAAGETRRRRTRRPAEILRSPGFYLLWVIYFIGAGAGLMVISSVSGMAKKSMGERGVRGGGRHGHRQRRGPHRSRHPLR